jgi:hypothetical protein
MRPKQSDEVLLRLFARSGPRVTPTNALCAFAFMTNGGRSEASLKRLHESLPQLVDWPDALGFKHQSIVGIELTKSVPFAD